MKRILAIMAFIVVAQVCEARPAFTNGQYYVWSDLNVAQAALNYINIDSEIFPFVQKFTKTSILYWQESVFVREDGKYCFPRIPESLLDVMKIPEGTRELFYTAFNPTIEIYQDNWFNEEE